MFACAVEPTSWKPMGSPIRLGDSNEASSEYETQTARITIERVDPRNQDKKIASFVMDQIMKERNLHYPFC